MLLIKYAKLHIRHDLRLLASIFRDITPLMNLFINDKGAAGTRIVLEAAPELVGTLLVIVLYDPGVST